MFCVPYTRKKKMRARSITSFGFSCSLAECFVLLYTVGPINSESKSQADRWEREYLHICEKPAFMCFLFTILSLSLDSVRLFENLKNRARNYAGLLFAFFSLYEVCSMWSFAFWYICLTGTFFGVFCLFLSREYFGYRNSFFFAFNRSPSHINIIKRNFKYMHIPGLNGFSSARERFLWEITCCVYLKMYIM